MQYKNFVICSSTINGTTGNLPSHPSPALHFFNSRICVYLASGDKNQIATTWKGLVRPRHKHIPLMMTVLLLQSHFSVAYLRLCNVSAPCKSLCCWKHVQVRRDRRCCYWAAYVRAQVDEYLCVCVCMWDSFHVSSTRRSVHMCLSWLHPLYLWRQHGLDSP